MKKTKPAVNPSKSSTPTSKKEKTQTHTKSTSIKTKKSQDKDDDEEVIVPKLAVDEEALRIQALQEKDERESKQKEFKDLGLKPELADAALKMGYKLPTKIQRESIPLALAGRDLIALAQTGSGKTAAFVLPVLDHLLEAPQPYFAVIMSPTRYEWFFISNILIFLWILALEKPHNLSFRFLLDKNWKYRVKNDIRNSSKCD